MQRNALAVVHLAGRQGREADDLLQRPSWRFPPASKVQEVVLVGNQGRGCVVRSAVDGFQHVGGQKARVYCVENRELLLARLAENGSRLRQSRGV